MEPEEREPLLTALENGQRQVGEAAATFEELLAQLESVREPVNRERFEADFQPLFDRIDAKLAEVIVLSETFSRGIEGLRTSVTETGARIRLQCRLVAGVLSLLVLWMGAGQWCLFQAGWRSIRPLPSSGGEEP